MYGVEYRKEVIYFYVLQLLYDGVQAFTPPSCSALSTVRKNI